jgi:hypothetical protein
LSGKKRQLPPPPGKKKKLSEANSSVVPPVKLQEITPSKNVPEKTLESQPNTLKKYPLSKGSPEAPPIFDNDQKNSVFPPISNDPSVKREEEQETLPVEHGILQNAAYQAAAKAKKTMPEPSSESQSMGPRNDSESMIAGSIEELFDEDEEEEEEEQQLESRKMPLPKPTSFKAPAKPKIIDDELIEEDFVHETISTSYDNDVSMPSLPDISKFTAITPKKKTSSSGSIDYSRMLQKKDDPPSNKMLVSEIKDVFQQGIQKTLVKAKKDDEKFDDSEIEKERYRRMKEDYEVAGKKFLDMQLYVNAAHSFALALVSQFLEGDISAVLWTLDDNESELPDIVKEAEIYQVAKGLMIAIKDKNTKNINIAEAIVKKVSFMSLDDERLMKKCFKVIKTRLS